MEDFKGVFCQTGNNFLNLWANELFSPDIHKRWEIIAY